MKNILSFLFVCTFLFLAACNATPKGTALEGGGESYGELIEPTNAISIADLERKIKGKQNVVAKIEGKVGAVCQKKGCWLHLTKPDGESMRVSFKDYGFFVPANCAGKTAIAKGVAMYDTTSVADLRHYAEDEGLSNEEILKITHPEIEMVFVADGVILK